MIEVNMVIVWAKPGGIMRDKMADKKVIMWAKEGGIVRDKKVIVLGQARGHNKGQDGRQEGHCVG